MTAMNLCSAPVPEREQGDRYDYPVQYIPDVKFCA